MRRRRSGEARPEPLFPAARTVASVAAQPTNGDDLVELGAQAVASIGRRRVAKKLSAPRQLPFSKQFTPAQVPSLSGFLRAVADAPKDPDEVQAAVFRFLHPADDEDRGSEQWTMAYNAILSAQHYGLISDGRDSLTPFATALLEAAADDASLIAEFARHILLNLNGLELVHGIQTLAQAGEQPDKMALARFFAEHGLASNADGTDINGLAGWLRAANVYAQSGWYVLDEARVKELVGLDLATVREGSRLSPESLAILEQLAMGPGQTSTSGELRRLLEARPDLRIDVAGFKKTHLEPLAGIGLIAIEKATRGRGGAATRVTGTELFRQDVVQRLLDQIRRYGITVSGPDLEVPFSVLVGQLRDRTLTRDQRGRALELFALRFLRRLGLTNIHLRARPSGAEEIDATAEGFAPVHARWQVQCKNSPSLDVDHAAKEVGVAVHNRSTVIVLLTTGRFTQPASTFVDEILRHTPFTILRLDGADVDALSIDETKIIDLLSREAERARNLRSGAGEAVPIPSEPTQMDGDDSPEDK